MLDKRQNCKLGKKNPIRILRFSKKPKIFNYKRIKKMTMQMVLFIKWKYKMKCGQKVRKKKAWLTCEKRDYTKNY